MTTLREQFDAINEQAEREFRQKGLMSELVSVQAQGNVRDAAIWRALYAIADRLDA